MTIRLAALVVLIAACKGDPEKPGPVTDPPSDTDTVDTDVADTDTTDTDTVDTDTTDTDPTTTACDDPEIPYDGIDNDCVGGDLTDVDGDGFDAEVVGGTDCDDSLPGVHPAALDLAGDGTDINCDGLDGVDRDADGVASEGSGGLDCDDHDPAAAWVLLGVAPTPGEVAPDAVFTATFAGDATGVAITLTLGVTPIPGTTTLGGAAGEVATFTPDSPLPLGETFELRVQGPCGEVAIVALSTAAIPLDVALLPGRGWSVDYMAGNWILPPGLGGLLGALGSSELLLTVPVADVGRVAPSDLGAPPAQMACQPTVDGALSYPDAFTFTMFSSDLYADFTGIEVPLEDVTLTGTSLDGGMTLHHFALTGAVKVGPLEPLLGAPVCPLLAAFAVFCGPCPHSPGGDCLVADIDDIPTVEVPGLVIDVLTEADILADPTCP